MAENQVTDEPSIESLNSKLDELFERYLSLLDEYQTAREQLSSQFSTGFISLAQANFASSTRTRFGQDYYDERMQAIRRVTLEKADSATPTFRIYSNIHQSVKASTESEDSSATGVEEDDDSPLPTPPSTPPAEADRETQASTATEPDDENETEVITVQDPLRWFGILVPPALRTAQSSFVNGVEGSIAKLVGLAAELRSIESEVSKARKAMKKLR